MTDKKEPATREVAMWDVHFAVRSPHGWEAYSLTCPSYAEALHSAERRKRKPRWYACVSVSGPRYQKVPA